MSKDNLAMAVYRIGLKSDKSYDKLGLIYGDGSEPTDEQIERLANCFNALQGIPTESLGEVKKAWLAWHLVVKFYDDIVDGLAIGDKDNQYCDDSEKCDRDNIDSVIGAAKKLRSRGADFGELNALLDSVKE